MFARNVTPVLNTGMRLAHGTAYPWDVAAFAQLAGTVLSALVKRRSGFWSPVHASPASKNGATSSGRYGKFTSPNIGDPKSGMRSSALKTAILLPNNRSNTGQRPVWGSTVLEHSDCSVE